MKQPVLAITMGDPGGVGPEIVVGTLKNFDLAAEALVIGDRRVLAEAERILGVTIPWKEAHFPLEGKGPFLLDLANVDMNAFSWGKVSAMSGRASFAYIAKAVEILLSGFADALVTAPISKEALHAASIPYIGHTEILEALTRAQEALTMFQVGNLRVFFFTRHVPLHEAVARVKKEPLAHFTRLVFTYLEALGVRKPRVAVAALNPHAGEGGLLGKEEEEEIRPAIATLKGEGYDVSGPYPADSVFFFAFQGRFDAVISLYHDQGHIATKCLDFYRTVSVTLGLPFIRTSPDHGTAFDIAGKGVARFESMYEACRVAASYAPLYAPPFENGT
ncbi:MAG: 4-hydroxythreonine-4-phosphate dehydrogenase PdxA [Atribacterota bacterium]